DRDPQRSVDRQGRNRARSVRPDGVRRPARLPGKEVIPIYSKARSGAMRRLTYLLVVLLVMTSGVAAAKENWPREIDTEFGKLTVSQPQPETFANNLLEGRAAVSVVPKGKKDPVFGVIWFAGK